MALACYGEGVKHSLIHKRIPLGRIASDPDSVHSKYSLAEDASALRESIREFGVMSGLLVCAAGRGRYLIIDGERRYRIARDLEFRELDCTIFPASGGGLKASMPPLVNSQLADCGLRSDLVRHSS